MHMIASWGSSGAGKTAVALALASAFAERKQDVLILSSDTRTPALPVLLPMVKDIDSRNSIGPLLGSSELTEAALKEKLIRHPKSSHVFCMGLASGEVAAISYPPPVRNAAISLFHLLNATPFHYVIVDCDSSPLFDQTTLAALEYAHTGLMVLTPDIKGYEFQKAQMGWLGNNDAFHLDSFLKVASPVCSYTPMSEARALFGGFDYELPHSPEVAEKMMAGELLSGFANTPGVRFQQQIRKLADTIERKVNDRG